MDRALGAKTKHHAPAYLWFSPHTVLNMFNSHMEVHVVGGAILVCICDVVDGANSQDNLPHCVNNGQVNNSPVKGGGGDQRDKRETKKG